MDDDRVAQFVAITESSVDKAQQYLRISDGNIEQAVELYFSTGGIDLELPSSGPAPASNAPPELADHTRPPAQESSRRHDTGVVNLDSDEEEMEDDDPVITGYTSRRRGGGPRSASRTPANETPPIPQSDRFEDEDAAMARRMQEEIYAGGDTGGFPDQGGYRAPIASTRETLVGPGAYDLTDRGDLQAAVEEQMRARERIRSRGRGGPGIFNQRTVGSNSIWNDADSNSDEHRARLARATAGASEASSKSGSLAEMYRPPWELMSRLPWDAARSEGKDSQKWILVNIQDPSVFDCQVLNRDLWKNSGIQDTVREHFIFMQYSKDDPKGSQYIQYYFQNRGSQDAYPHIAIVDPRTGEQVKVWSGPPSPKPMDFLMQLHEFLDRYSLSVSAKNPVARRKPESRKEKEVHQMTEEEMLEMALQNSLAGSSGDAKLQNEEDPDALTRSIADTDTLSGPAADTLMADANAPLAAPTQNANGHPSSAFAYISATSPHTEPPAADPASTRIQFRHPNGRVVRRFLLSDPVRRIYEWLKAEPLEGMGGGEFELVFLGKNLLGRVGEGVGEVGLRNGTVMVEGLGLEG